MLIICHIPIAMKLVCPRKLSSLYTECPLVTPGADGKALWRRDIILSSSARNTKVTLVLFSYMTWVCCDKRIQWWTTEFCWLKCSVLVCKMWKASKITVVRRLVCSYLHMICSSISLLSTLLTSTVHNWCKMKPMPSTATTQGRDRQKKSINRRGL